MTVSAEHSENLFTGNGVTVSFPFTFVVVIDDPEVLVYKDNVLQLAGVTITPNADQEASPGGTAVFAVAPANGLEVKVKRDTEQTQLATFTLEGKLNTPALEGALDKVVLMTQENKRDTAQNTFNFEGAWNVLRTYQPGDSVTIGGSTYFCLNVNTTSQPPSADWALLAAKGDQGIQGIQGVQGIQGIQGIQGPVGPAGANYPQVAQAANFNAVVNTLFRVNTSGGNRTAAIPAGTTVGDRIEFKHLVGGNSMILDGTVAGVTMDGSSILTSVDQGDFYSISWTGTTWMVVS